MAKLARRYIKKIFTSYITRQLEIRDTKCSEGSNIPDETDSTVGCVMMTKNTHMSVQNHSAPVKYREAGYMVSKQSCQNTIISGW